MLANAHRMQGTAVSLEWTAGSYGVRNQLEQAPVRVAEVDARAGATRPQALDRAELDFDSLAPEMLDGALDRSVPDEAEVAVPRPDRVGRARKGLAARPVHVQLLAGEPVGPTALVELDELGAEDISVEAVRPLPVRDRNDDVVEAQRGDQRKPIRFGGQ